MIGRYRRELSVAAVYATLLLMLAVLPLFKSGESGVAVPSFFDNQFHASLVSSAPVLLMAVGMTLVILCRQIDISVGSQFSVCGVAAGLAAKAGLPMPLVAVVTLITGAAMGAVNGAFIAGLGLPSIVVTLATMVTLREGLRWAREGEFVRDLPAEFQWFGAAQDDGQRLVVVGALAVFLVFAWGLRYVAAGRAVYASGSDPEAARLAGIRPRGVTLAVFIVMGALTGLAALLNAVRFPQVDPNVGTGRELQVIAAVVIGGTAISGGRGTLVGTLIGVGLLRTIGPALVFLGAEPQWEKAIQGAIILAAVASDALDRRGR